MAQLDSASVFGTEGCRFESCRAYWVAALPPYFSLEDISFTLGLRGFFVSDRGSVRASERQTAVVCEKL